tara:strand:+ start:149 stop:847 length:699 start_codon:yes stop_codon:yes gene_type:complete
MSNNRNNHIGIIKESREREIATRREWEIFGSVQLIVKDHPPSSVSIQDIIQELEEKIPRSFIQTLDVIYVGQFEHLISREVEAIYQDGAIYVSNEQPTEDDFVESIGHEIAHSLEEAIPMEIYSDGIIEEEFLGKRRRLWSILKSRDLATDEDRVYFEQPDYSKRFDTFLYKEIGYPVLTSLTMGLFLSPYAATSLREYFANAFESFFLNDEANYVKQISPAVYNKLIDLSN